MKMQYSFLMAASYLLFQATASAAMATHLTWNQPKVAVCFANVDTGKKLSYTIKKWTQEEKDLITRTVENEFTYENTGFKFVGFEDCEKKSYHPNITLVKESGAKSFKVALFGGHAASSTVGRTLVYPNPNYPAYGIIKFTNSGLNTGTILHEFGHSAGLYHEHDHYDAHKVDGNCRHTSAKSTEQRAIKYTEYDPHSIMNYCAGFREMSALSEQDREMLRSIYMPYLEAYLKKENKN